MPCYRLFRITWESDILAFRCQWSSVLRNVLIIPKSWWWRGWTGSLRQTDRTPAPPLIAVSIYCSMLGWRRFLSQISNLLFVPKTSSCRLQPNMRTVHIRLHKVGRSNGNTSHSVTWLALTLHQVTLGTDQVTQLVIVPCHYRWLW